MFRVALIAYLSLATVFGPLLCCCSMQRLFAVVEISECCGKSGLVRTNAEDTQHAAHVHHHAHSQVNDTSKFDPSPTGDQHDGQNCPCGKHLTSLVASDATDGVQLKAVELQAQYLLVVVAFLPVLPDFDAKDTSLIAQVGPADLYGRELLRAYQIMRC